VRFFPSAYTKKKSPKRKTQRGQSGIKLVGQATRKIYFTHLGLLRGVVIGQRAKQVSQLTRHPRYTRYTQHATHALAKSRDRDANTYNNSNNTTPIKSNSHRCQQQSMPAGQDICTIYTNLYT